MEDILITLKDSERVNWSIKLVRLDIEVDLHGDEHIIWRYTLINEDTNQTVYSSSLTGQYDIEPTTRHVAFDIARKFSELMLCFMQDGVKQHGTKNHERVRNP